MKLFTSIIIRLSMNKIIKDHAKLAEEIKGKKILHLNSLGKDSAVTLHWLSQHAKDSEIISVHFKYLSGHPLDMAYFKYQENRYKNIKFIVSENCFEASFIAQGLFQSPSDIFRCFNHFEYNDFNFKLQYNEIAKNNNCDFICLGHARYESFTRASSFHKKGIMQGNEIFPIGMFSKELVFNTIKYYEIMLHPFYKSSKSSLDTPSYYKMRRAFILNPEYKKAVYKYFPMLVLDEFRYEKLLKKGRS